MLMLENLLNQQDIVESDTPSINDNFIIIRPDDKRELNLVDNLLNLRLIDANVYPCKLSSIQIQNWLPCLIESFQNFAHSQQQTLTVDISRDLPILITDLEIISLIFSELLNNACKYTPAGGEITVNTQLTNKNLGIDVSYNNQNPCFQIRVSNSGIEIPAAEQSRIFEPYYQIIYSKNCKKPLINSSCCQIHFDEFGQNNDTGLGLALLKKLVKYIQGEIEVTSVQNWTNFTVYLPLVL